ncbi:MAG: hypothetical protein WBQ89_17030 [Candidatus Acidiferrum sp.]
MKCRILAFAVLFFGGIASAQQNTTVQLQCHDLASSNNFVGPDETIINGMVCKEVKQVATPKQVAPPATAVASAQSANSGLNATPAAPPPAATSETKKDVVQPSVHRQCLILKRMGPADEITSHMYSFGIRGKQFQYVEGDFPAGVKFHGRLTDHDVREIQSHGGKVVMMEPKYSADDLREAKQSCKDE